MLWPLFLLFSFVVSSMNLFGGDIRVIYSIKEAESVLQNLDQDALVVFDVDETLIVSKDVARRMHPRDSISKVQNVYFDTIKDAEYRKYINSVLLLMSEQKLIEPEITHIITDLQRRNIHVIVLTHMLSGSYHCIENMEKWRFAQLYELGIDISVGNPHTINFFQLPHKNGRYPSFYKGVFATARRCTKGAALAAYIKELNLNPSKVIFFDDLLEHVQTVSDAMSECSIPSIAYHYKATEITADELDIELAHFQYKYLLQHEVWLNDAQARDIMMQLSK